MPADVIFPHVCLSHKTSVVSSPTVCSRTISRTTLVSLSQFL